MEASDPAGHYRKTLRYPKTSTSAFDEGTFFLLEAEVLVQPEPRDSRSKKKSAEMGNSPKGYTATRTLFIGAHVSIAGGLYINPYSYRSLTN